MTRVDDAAFGDDRWQRLATRLASIMHEEMPDWADHQDADPGITIIELLAFLAERLMYRASAIPERSRVRLSDAVASLETAMAGGVATVAGAEEQFARTKRVNYFFGQLLSVDDFRDEQQYWLDKHRSHNRLLHGWGVVSGLGVTTNPAGGRIVVERGVAIDRVGRDIVLREPATLTSSATSPMFVVVAYVERCTDQVPTPGSSGESGHTTATRIEEGVSVRFAEQEDPDGVTIGRVVPGAGGWHVDTAFRPRKVSA